MLKLLTGVACYFTAACLAVLVCFAAWINDDGLNWAGYWMALIALLFAAAGALVFTEDMEDDRHGR